MTIITIDGHTPSKKNSRNLFVRRGKIVNIPSKQYEEWAKSAGWQLRQYQPFPSDSYPLGLRLEFYFKDQRRKDIDNAIGSVMDVLVSAGIIPDDDYKHVAQIQAIYKSTDKNNPRVEILPFQI